MGQGFTKLVNAMFNSHSGFSFFHFQLFQGILLNLPDIPVSFYIPRLGKRHLHGLCFHLLEKSLVWEITCLGIGQPDDPAQSVCPRAVFFILYYLVPSS